MTRPVVTNFAGRTALVLHRSAEIGQQIRGRCDRLGMRTVLQVAQVDAALGDAADVVLLDIDTAHDGQLPWPPGRAPVPVIGLVGSESPGRLAWALHYGMDGYLPLSALANLYSALVIAHDRLAERHAQRQREADRARQNAGRLDVIRAVMMRTETTGDPALALKQLRALAMVDRISLEEAAARMLGRGASARKAGS